MAFISWLLFDSVPDALSRWPDFFTVILNVDDMKPHLEQYLINKTLPEDPAMRKQLLENADSFVVDTNL